MPNYFISYQRRPMRQRRPSPPKQALPPVHVEIIVGTVAEWLDEMEKVHKNHYIRIVSIVAVPDEEILNQNIGWEFVERGKA